MTHSKKAINCIDHFQAQPPTVLGRLKPSDSSFGLHSPDNLQPLGFNPEEHQDGKVQVRHSLKNINGPER